MQLVLDTKGIVMKKRNDCFHLQTDKQERLISPLKVSSIAITSDCSLSTSAIRLAIEHEIPIYLLNNLGKVEGRLWAANFGHQASVRRKQAVFQQTIEANNWVIAQYEDKIKRQIETLQDVQVRTQVDISDKIEAMQRIKGNLDELTNKPLHQTCDQIRGQEASAARIYWQSIGKLIPAPMSFAGRSQFPAKDRFNAALNYLYGMLYGVVETALFSTGLDPYMGIFHADQYNKPTLSFDLIESFRPWIDQLLIKACFEWDISASHFTETADQVSLGKKGKQLFIPAFNQFMVERTLYQHKNHSHKTVIYQHAYQLVKMIEQT